MKQHTYKALLSTVVLSMGVFLSGCSNISDSLSDSVSGLNPFQQTTESPANVTTPTPSHKEAPDSSSAAGLWVQSKPAAPPKQPEGVDVNVGNNKQCTTFCALPLRKPPAAAK
ncbi:hypothetical protein RCF98_15545 [Thiothrix lacustris]|uniref:Uncharacterized protein n=1 Tax=Thiothrix lacustris TaxID=525917 RepID=A0ABY9MNY0_9GAMM|nr:hypothetical protein [Thiothrix lacustris]WML90371.1 hypothetical protein RCF98_15545 [Thiothrix lacustris]